MSALGRDCIPADVDAKPAPARREARRRRMDRLVAVAKRALIRPGGGQMIPRSLRSAMAAVS
jgi:hypothetical protein